MIQNNYGGLSAKNFKVLKSHLEMVMLRTVSILFKYTQERGLKYLENAIISEKRWIVKNYKRFRYQRDGMQAVYEGKQHSYFWGQYHDFLVEIYDIYILPITLLQLQKMQEELNQKKSDYQALLIEMETIKVA